MKVNILTGKIAWFGKHSGYEPLTDYFPKSLDADIVSIGKSYFGKLVGKILQVFFKWENKNKQDIYAELKFLILNKKKTVSHVLYLEDHVNMISKLWKKKQNLIGTIHIPFVFWQEEHLQHLKSFEQVIILYREEMHLFAQYVPLHKMHFIRLGISVDFFRPDANKPVNKNKVLIVGHFLRNFEMLLSVYQELTKDPSNELEFNILIPSRFRNIPALNEMVKNSNVFFHENLSDQQMLEKYQEGYVLLLPMSNSGANTAIVQALATGTPIITTDIGGIRSYGGGEVFPIVENNDVEGMVSLFNRYYQDMDFRNMIAGKQRKFAEQYLDWNIVAKEHIDFYQKVQNTL